MTVYINKGGGGWSRHSGQWVNKDNHSEVMPESMPVTVSKLAVGDIVLIHEYQAGIIRSAAVTLIEKMPEKTWKQYKITTVDGNGKVDVYETSGGRIYQFERQCSQETKENAEERDRNIGLRRDIQRLEGKVADLVRDMGWFLEHGGKNPKMPTYKAQVDQFAADLAAMYDDVGNDLGLPTRAQRKAEKDAKKKK